MIDLVDRHVLVAGLGVTGVAVARTLLAHGAQVTAIDAKGAAAVPEGQLAQLREQGLTLVSDLPAEAPQLVVASPGWAPHSPLLTAARERGIAIWSEVELAWHLRVATATGEPAPWLVVTGTNGKTTTATMAAAMLTSAGRNVRAVGNIGSPIITAVGDASLDALIVEISSFQLHYTYSMRPHAAALLNIAADHLDWHGSWEAYVADKARVFANTEVACIYPADDTRIEDLVREADVAEGARAVAVTAATPGLGMLGVVDGIMCDRAFASDRRTHAQELATLADISAGQAPPPYLVTNALSAAALALAVQTPPAAIRDGLRTYESSQLGHRGQLVATVDGVAYVDNSKATNPHAAAAALSGVSRAVWIAGGDAKGVSFDDLIHQQRDKLRAVVLIGVDQAPLRGALERHAPEVPVFSIGQGDTDKVDGATATGGESVMVRAVRQARELARAGDTVLLAPACASIDQFSSYRQRGEFFSSAVRALAGRGGASNA